jgi:DNA invertase Pin-like site-specific DNA recombinase
MLGAIAEFEVNLIAERACEGRARALAKGGFGVKPKLGKAKLAEMCAELSRPGSNKSELAKRYGIARSTLYRLV